jgi:hypothetical protein
VRHGDSDLEATVFLNDPFHCQIKVTILTIDGIIDIQYEDVLKSNRSMVSSKSFEALSATKVPRSISLDVGNKKIIAEKVKPQPLSWL